MASLNKVQLIGHLGADPETRYLPNGDAVTNVRIATSERWKDKASGEEKERTEWHRINFWGRTAEVAGEYLKKGAQIYVEGSIHTRKWQDKDGNDRYSTEIRGDRMLMLGSKPAGAAREERSEPEPEPEPEPKKAGAADAGGGAKPAAKKPAGRFDDMADDIPF